MRVGCDQAALHRAARIQSAGALRHDVVEAERVDLRERVTSGALAHRHHRDDGSDSEHDAKNTESGTQAIAAESFDRDAQEFAELSAAEAHCEQGLLPGPRPERC